MGRPCEIQLPEPEGPLVDEATSLPAPLLQAPQPVSQGKHVMLPEALHVPHFETARLRRPQRRGDRQQFPVRKDVMVGKGALRVIEWVNRGHLRHARKDPVRQGSPETLLSEGTGHDPGSRLTAQGVRCFTRRNLARYFER